MAHILVVEDDDRLRQAIAFVAHHRGHRVSEARNGLEGIKLHRSDHADLILTDLLMPEMNGLEMIADVLKDDKYAKIIAISGAGAESGKDYLGMAAKLGASRVLAKPFAFSAVNVLIAELLDTDSPPHS